MVYFLFLLIFTEGFVVLATELLAVRLMVPMVGSATDTVSVIIAAVLMPLAFGYYAGGNYRVRARKPGKRKASVRMKLLRNLVTAGFILSFGLSMIVINMLFAAFEAAGIYNRVLQTAVYAAIFIVYPVFLLGQTIPLASNFFTQKTLSQLKGRMLSFSTFGSFAGSILTTLVLMTYFGVHNTVIFTIGLLIFILFFLARKKQRIFHTMGLAIFGIAFVLNNTYAITNEGIVSDNRYATVKVLGRDNDPEHTRVLVVNNGYFAAYSDKKKPLFDYLKFIDEHYVAPIRDAKGPPKHVLVLGGGGFTVGMNDTKNDYTYVDINPDIKHISETYLLREKLTPNKHFIPEDARAYIRQNKKKYNMVVLDAYTAIKALPPSLLTREYFMDVRRALKDGSTIVMNVIACPNFGDKLSVRLDNTVRSVFPQINRTVAAPPDYSGWKDYRDKAGDCDANVIYSTTVHHADRDDLTIYTDDKNTTFMDKGKNP